jgi:hypothetical protein
MEFLASQELLGDWEIEACQEIMVRMAGMAKQVMQDLQAQLWGLKKGLKVLLVLMVAMDFLEWGAILVDLDLMVSKVSQESREGKATWDFLVCLDGLEAQVRKAPKASLEDKQPDLKMERPVSLHLMECLGGQARLETKEPLDYLASLVWRVVKVLLEWVSRDLKELQGFLELLECLELMVIGQSREIKEAGVLWVLWVLVENKVVLDSGKKYLKSLKY